MTAHYPHAPTCHNRKPWPDGATLAEYACSCGATALQSAFDSGKREAALRFVSYTGDGVCPWCSALNAQGDGKAGGDTEHFATCPYVSASVTRICDARAEGKEAGRKEADARAMAVVEMAIRWAEADTPVTPEDDALFDALVSQGFITKDGKRR
jgi:hypothetical protein